MGLLWDRITRSERLKCSRGAPFVPVVAAAPVARIILHSRASSVKLGVVMPTDGTLGISVPMRGVTGVLQEIHRAVHNLLFKTYGNTSNEG
jgi:hypothetical protein